MASNTMAKRIKIQITITVLVILGLIYIGWKVFNQPSIPVSNPDISKTAEQIDCSDYVNYNKCHKVNSTKE